ncbi:MAG TPA: hypothetical protein VK154_18710 [Chitinophagales bacterium]|nr:hypothetical protein [Chitinophagales bacterium]
MYLRLLTIAFAIISSSCNSNTGKAPQQNNGSTIPTQSEVTQQQNGNEPATGGNQPTGSGSWEKLVPVPFKDNQGQVTAVMPLPSSWKLGTGNGQPTFTGPNGIKVTDYPAQSFMYVTDPRLQQSYYQSGMKMRAMPGVDALIQQDIAPWAANRGLQYVRHYEVPEVSKIDKWYSDQLYKAVPSRTEMVAIGTEWKSADGAPFFMLLHINVSNTAEMQNWYYMATSVEAEPEYFERAKKQLLFSLANTHYPLEPIMAYNQREAQKAGQSWAAFNQRMAQNQANFEASQRAHVNKTNAINDAIMGNWRASNESSDRQHEQFVDAITERTKVVDPTTGQQYKVSSGYNHYWMNSDGHYISTDKFSYNPNLDENINNIKWQELNEVKY